MITVFTYNTDTRMPADYRSRDAILDSEEFKQATGQYVFSTYHPNFCEGFDDHIVVFDKAEEFQQVLEDLYHPWPGHTNVFTLEHHDPRMANVYCNKCYTGRLQLRSDAVQLPPKDTIYTVPRETKESDKTHETK